LLKCEPIAHISFRPLPSEIFSNNKKLLIKVDAKNFAFLVYKWKKLFCGKLDKKWHFIFTLIKNPFARGDGF
jgi:hypothetical protein